MADSNPVTIQTNAKTHSQDSIKNYALFMGGTNVTHDVLECYDPLRTGYDRLFMVRKPNFLATSMGDKFNKFKHILEYAHTSISGISDINVEFNTITGGYVGKSFEIPNVAREDTTSFSVTVYEFSGSPVREILHSWINGSTDLLTGLTHYNGKVTVQGSSDGIPALQANQTAEFIYVNTDVTGTMVEYATLLANCFPRSINTSVFNAEAGTHNLVEVPIEFTCTAYQSPQINKVAQKLLTKYQILANSLNFYSGYDVSKTDFDGEAKGKHYDVKTGQLVEGELAAGSMNKVSI